MYNNSPYEDYMMNSLGYHANPMMNMNFNNSIYEEENCFTYNQLNVDEMYPEIYKIIYPMVCKACMNVSENISEDLVSRITNEIYVNVEDSQTMQENRSVPSSASMSNSKNARTEVSNNRTNTSTVNVTTTPSAREDATVNTRQESRNRNPLLRDLIRILVLRELLGNQNNGPRPPYRPPFGGGFNPGPGPRPYMF